MTHNNNFNPLPWYTSLEQQNHRKPYAYGRIYPLYTLANTMLPWQIQMQYTDRIESVTFEVYQEDGTLYFTSSSMPTDVSYITVDNNKYMVYYPTTVITYRQPDGRYYAKITVVTEGGTETYYSEVYTVVQSLDGFLKIEWYDVEDLEYQNGVICYPTTPIYHNFIYLPTELGKPEYTFEETGEDRDGFYFPEKQLSEKTYRFSFLAPEYMLDALRIVRLSDYVTITDQQGVDYAVDKFLMTPKWLQDGDMAQVEAEFQTNTVIKKIGRGIVTGSSAQ